MINLIKFIALTICIAQSVYAQNSQQKLNEKYLNYYLKLQSDPQSVLDDILSNSNSDNNHDNTQHQYILSQAYYALVFPEKAIKHALLGLELVDKNKQPWMYYKLQLSLALAHDVAGNPSKGVIGAKESLNWAKLNQVPDLVIEALTTTGYLNLSMGKYVESLDVLQQAYEMAKESQIISHEEIAGVIALVYEYRKENELSIPFFIEVAEYHRNKNNWLELSIALYGLGRAHMATGKTDLGLKELQESADISTQVEDHQGVGYALKEMAGYAISQGNYQESEKMLLKSLEAFKLSQNRLMLFDTYKVLTHLKLKTNQLDHSQAYLEKAMTYIDENKHPHQFIAIKRMATDVLAHKGEFERAFKDLRNLINKEKRLITEQSTQQLHQLRSKYELDSKEKENKILSQKVELKNTKILAQNQHNNLLHLLFIFAIIFIGMLLFIAIRLRKNKKHFEYLANYDDLTGVYTRSKTLSLLNNAFEHVRENQQMLCVGMMDLDYFKNINDKFGHAAGDLVLKEVGHYLLNLINNNDICGRFGGEEFVVGLINTSTKKAHDTFEKIRNDIELMHKNHNNDDLKITVSIGFCSNSQHNNIDAMIKCADDALYQAKENGRNQIILI